MRTPVSLVAVLALAGAAAVHAAPVPDAAPRTVPCGESIDTTRFPYVTGNYRVVLGAIAVPPRHLPELYESGTPGWRYWRKAGIVVRDGGAPVTITVPPRWRNRLGIRWGNAGHGVLTSLRLSSCGRDRARGHAYAGGFLLRSRPACVPLRLQAGGRRATVWFGLGRHCPG